MNIKETAKRYLEQNIRNDEWPEDEWVSLNDEYDMNIYIDEDEKKEQRYFPS